MRVLCNALVAAALAGLAGCGESAPETESAAEMSAAELHDALHEAIEGDPDDQAAARRFDGMTLDMPRDLIVADPARSAARTALFGDLHVHTKYSFDAFAFGTIASPYDAYRYAEGEAIAHPAGFDVRLPRPLDFYSVTDHAMFLGAVSAAADTSTEFSRYPFVRDLNDLNAPSNMTFESLPQRLRAFQGFLGETLSGVVEGRVDGEMVDGIARAAWADIVAAAEAHYRPGSFTTFVGYEYTTSTDDRGNLHRNVIFRDADKLPAVPFSRFHSQNPEDLWDWMDGLRAEGIEALAIPHNANGSNGQMFKLVDWAGNPLDDGYAAQRIRNEPLIELTQIKGTSETHPLLSDTDEWADFEIMPYRVATTLPSEPVGSYARYALLDGLKLADQGIVNAYQFGFVAASDTHTGAASFQEETFFSKVGLVDADGERRGSVPLSPGNAEIVRSAGRVNLKEINGEPYASGGYETWGASGLTGVWAERNDRDSIYRAFRRKETFATSGPRMKIRLFAGVGIDEALVAAPDHLERLYRDHTAMGGELLAGSGAPALFAWASQDADSAPLQRLQIIKGWTVDGEHHERVFDVACADGSAPAADAHRCADNGAAVDLSDCSISADSGAAELKAVWRDPDFDASLRAFYYARVLENPTCRWSTWDALKAGTTPRPDLPATLQERAWSSPIWVQPAS
ncbi:MAG: DUF3604 domain-containing protein [Pseudomonadota bacterium]